MPATQPGARGSTSSAPTIVSLPRGSQATAERKASWWRAKSARCSASVSPRNAGAPLSTTRVGSPAVWESMTAILCMP